MVFHFVEINWQGLNTGAFLPVPSVPECISQFLITSSLQLVLNILSLKKETEFWNKSFCKAIRKKIVEHCYKTGLWKPCCAICSFHTHKKESKVPRGKQFAQAHNKTLTGPSW